MAGELSVLLCVCVFTQTCLCCVCAKGKRLNTLGLMRGIGTWPTCEWTLGHAAMGKPLNSKQHVNCHPVLARVAEHMATDPGSGPI